MQLVTRHWPLAYYIGQVNKKTHLVLAFYGQAYYSPVNSTELLSPYPYSFSEFDVWALSGASRIRVEYLVNMEI